MPTAAPYQTDFVQIRDCRVELLRAGAWPPLLALHGAGDAGQWNPAPDNWPPNTQCGCPLIPDSAAPTGRIGSIVDDLDHGIELHFMIGPSGGA